MNIVLFEPEIPPNTGNIIRLCANTGSNLHLIEPLGFDMNEKALRRAGLDYHEWSNTQLYQSWPAFLQQQQPKRVWAFSTHAHKSYSDIEFEHDDYLLFGPETRGLPPTIRHSPEVSDQCRIPMRAESRSLNLSNSVAIVVYEALRQQQFIGLL